MAVLNRGVTVRNAVYGNKVERATSNLAQSTSLNLFSVTGRIIITGLVGEVTTIVQAQATTLKLQTISTVGSIVTDLSATVDMTGAAVGTLFGYPGGTANAAVIGSNVLQPNETVVQAGFIRMLTVASSTGQMKWSITWVPFDDNGNVVAV